MPLKTVRKFVFSCKGEQQLSASLRFANQIAGVVKLFSLAVGVGAPAASFCTLRGMDVSSMQVGTRRPHPLRNKHRPRAFP